MLTRVSLRLVVTVPVPVVVSSKGVDSVRLEWFRVPDPTITRMSFMRAYHILDVKKDPAEAVSKSFRCHSIWSISDERGLSRQAGRKSAQCLFLVCLTGIRSAARCM